MVVHLWGKFFMAAWRGRRRATWITGVVSFVVSVGAAFTGYLSQQNFDSQWISTQAKDGINSTGAGAIFNVTNFGQMLMWHIVLLPLVVVVLVGGHVLLVRRRGVVPPFAPPGLGAAGARTRDRVGDGRWPRQGRGPAMSGGAGTKRHRPFNPDRDVEEWHGKYLPYDLVKEFIIAFVVVAILVVGLAVVFSSPDETPVTVKSWSTPDPVDFAQTAITELDGTSGTATYGPPYNSTPGASQSIGPFSPESWLGRPPSHRHRQRLRHRPARTLPDQPDSCRPRSTSTRRPRRPSRPAWTAAYEKAVAKATYADGVLTVPRRRLRAGRAPSSPG